MTLRPVLAVAAVFILAAVNGYLIFNEEIAPPEQRVRHEMEAQDRLIDLQYSKARREENMAAFGFDDSGVKETLRTLQHMEDLYAEKLSVLLADAPEPIELADAFCATSTRHRPRYDGLRFLVEEKKGQRVVIDLQRVTSLDRQDWAVSSAVGAVYQEVELVEEPKADASVMGVAAILLLKEEAVLEGFSPWGRSLAPGSWSWSGVVKQNPGIDEQVRRYFALMHLVVEMSVAEDGICGF